MKRSRLIPIVLFLLGAVPAVSQVTIQLKNGRVIHGRAIVRPDTLVYIQRPVEYPDAKVLAVPTTAIESVVVDSLGREADQTHRYVTEGELEVPNSGFIPAFKVVQKRPASASASSARARLVLTSGDVVEGRIIEGGSKLIVIGTSGGDIPIAMRDIDSLNGVHVGSPPVALKPRTEPPRGEIAAVVTREGGRLVPVRTRGSAADAGFFSLLLPGAGQIYNGNYFRGVVTLGVWAGSLTYYFSQSTPREPAFLVLAAVTHVFAVGEALYTASRPLEPEASVSVIPGGAMFSLNLRF